MLESARAHYLIAAVPSAGKSTSTYATTSRRLQRHTGRVITITNYLARQRRHISHKSTKVTHLTKMADGARGLHTLRARGGERTAQLAARSTAHGGGNTKHGAVAATRSRWPIPSDCLRSSPTHICSSLRPVTRAPSHRRVCICAEYERTRRRVRECILVHNMLRAPRLLCTSFVLQVLARRVNMRVHTHTHMARVRISRARDTNYVYAHTHVRECTCAVIRARGTRHSVTDEESDERGRSYVNEKMQWPRRTRGFDYGRSLCAYSADRTCRRRWRRMPRNAAERSLSMRDNRAVHTYQRSQSSIFQCVSFLRFSPAGLCLQIVNV